jgi:hypothetical protein
MNSCTSVDLALGSKDLANVLFAYRDATKSYFAYRLGTAPDLQQQRPKAKRERNLGTDGGLTCGF